MDSLLSANLVWSVLAIAAFCINVLALIYIPRDRKPTAAMAWLLLVFLLPFIGIALYLLIGDFRLPKKRRDEQQRITAMIAERALDLPDAEAPRWLQRVAQQNHALTGLPMVGASSAQLIDDYQASIDAMAAAIDSAERYVHVEFYIAARDETTRGFFDAMERAVARGVTVRLLADYIASRKIPKSEETFAELDPGRRDVIGSSNMDVRFFSLNSEMSLLVRGGSFVAQMRQVEQKYRAAGRELTLDEWLREPAKSTFLDGLFRLTSALN